MEDTMMYDGDQQRYLQLLANGGEEEAAIDASDIDSSDVASSNDVDSDDDESDLDDQPEKGGGQKGASTSVVRSEGLGKRGRSQIGVSAASVLLKGDRAGAISAASEAHPLLTEIASKSERRAVATTRWFSDPLFEGVDESVGALPTNDTVLEDEGEEVEKPPTKRVRKDDETGRRRQRGKEDASEGEGPTAAEALLAAMPKTEKEKRKEKRKKVCCCRHVVHVAFHMLEVDGFLFAVVFIATGNIPGVTDFAGSLQIIRKCFFVHQPLFGIVNLAIASFGQLRKW